VPPSVTKSAPVATLYIRLVASSADKFILVIVPASGVSTVIIVPSGLICVIV